MNTALLGTGMIVAALLAGCGSDPASEVRGEFLSGCVQSGASRALCTCAFDELEADHSIDELRTLNRPSTDPNDPRLMDLVSATATAIMVCDRAM